MKQALSKKSLMSNTLQVGGSNLASKMLGIIREVLTVRYLGVSAAADAFITAWKIPNSLRKIFAEGALSAAFIPMLVKKVKEGKRAQVYGLISLGFVVFEGIVLLLCVLVMCNAHSVVWLMAPGFEQSQIIKAMPYLQILMPFIFFVSSSALLAGALESVNHFFVPAFSPILLNVVFIGALLVCLQYNLPVQYLCYFIVSGGVLQFVWHLVTFFKLGFAFGPITKETRSSFLTIISKFANCLLSMSVMELSLIIDTQFASMLGEGSVALIYYANRFMGIPLSVFATAFSTILLPHLSHVVTYAPKRLGFYVLEATKLIFWVTLPMTLLMIFFAQDIFVTIFLSDKFPIDKICIASQVLVAFMTGLFFFSLNRTLLNVYYALHNTLIPAIVSAIGACANIALNWIFIDYLGCPGLAYATVLSAILQGLLYLHYLRAFAHIRLYSAQLVTFIARYIVQVVVIGGLFLVAYYSIQGCIIYVCPPVLSAVLLHTLMLWLWVGPLCCAAFAALYYLRALFKVKVYFLEK